MTKQYLMGLDVGTQSAKVVIFDLEGNPVCQGQHPLQKMKIPAPLLAEHPDDDLWDASQQALQQAMTQFTHELRGKPEELLAMGICIIRCCRVLLKADGRLAYPVINWMDKRLNSPYVYSDKYGDVRYVTTTSGYITHRLTGQFKDTCANYIGWWPMDDDTFDWSTDPDFMEQCQVPRNQLFTVVKPGTVLGLLTQEVANATGVPEGLPIVATAHDKAVEALGAGLLTSNTALISLGTYIGALVHGQENIKEAKTFWPFQASIPNRYLYECMGVRRGMWTISWFCEQFGQNILEEATQTGLTIEEIFNQEAETVPAGCEGLITIHDWAPPPEATYRKGAILGFDGRHTRAHIYRSFWEGIAFTLKNTIDPMMTELERPLENLIVSGGGAHSDLAMQIFADVFGVPTRRNLMKSSAAVGCAINAGMAMGVFTSYEEAIQKMVKNDDSFSPNLQNIALYCQLNEKVYQKVHSHLDPIFQNLSPLVD